MLSISVICYLFLGGVGAGACMALFCMGLLSPTAFLTQGHERSFQPPILYRRLFVPSFVAAFVVLLIGAVCLFVDLGRMDRVLNIFIMPSFSYLSIGSYTLALLILISLVGVVVWNGGFRHVGMLTVRMLEIFGVVASFSVMVYTGLLLQSMGAVSFWQTPLLPILFIMSSVSTGIALIVVVACFTGSLFDFSSTICRLIKVDALIIIIELVLLALMLLLALQQNDTINSASKLLSGDLSLVFWGFLVVCGLLLPLILEVFSFSKISSGLVLVITIAVLIGGFALRYCMANAGTYAPLTFVTVV